MLVKARNDSFPAMSRGAVALAPTQRGDKMNLAASETWTVFTSSLTRLKMFYGHLLPTEVSTCAAKSDLSATTLLIWQKVHVAFLRQLRISQAHVLGVHRKQTSSLLIEVMFLLSFGPKETSVCEIRLLFEMFLFSQQRLFRPHFSLMEKDSGGR